MNDQTPVTISIVGTGTADGGGVAPTPHGTVVNTPGNQPNLLIQVVTPAIAIGVRFAHSYLQTMMGLLVAIGIGNEALPFTTFTQAVVASAGGALTVACLGLVKDMITIFGRLEGKYPLVTGSI